MYKFALSIGLILLPASFVISLLPKTAEMLQYTANVS